MTVTQALNYGKTVTDLASARFLLAAALDCQPGELVLQLDTELTSEQQDRYQALLDRRSANEPVAYILGYKDFCGLRLTVNSDTLIPRPETEQLIELVLYYAKKHSIKSIIDVGTGSGAIALSLAKSLPEASVTATDTSTKALAVAQQNATLNNIQNVIFKQANLLEAGGHILTADLIVANLPYIPSSRIAELEPDVKDFEPHLALDGGSDGLDLYRKLFDQISSSSQLPQVIFCEIDETHDTSFPKLAKKYWPKADVSIEHDLASLPRFARLALDNSL